MVSRSSEKKLVVVFSMTCAPYEGKSLKEGIKFYEMGMQLFPLNFKNVISMLFFRIKTLLILFKGSTLYHVTLSYLYFYTIKVSLIDYEIHLLFFVNHFGEFVWVEWYITMGKERERKGLHRAVGQRTGITTLLLSYNWCPLSF